MGIRTGLKAAPRWSSHNWFRRGVRSPETSFSGMENTYHTGQYDLYVRSNTAANPTVVARSFSRLVRNSLLHVFSVRTTINRSDTNSALYEATRTNGMHLACSSRKCASTFVEREIAARSLFTTAIYCTANIATSSRNVHVQLTLAKVARWMKLNEHIRCRENLPANASACTEHAAALRFLLMVTSTGCGQC